MTGFFDGRSLIGDLVVGRGQPGRGVDDPDDDVRLAHGLLGLQADVGQQIAFARVEPDAAGIDDGELAFAPLGGAVQAVARRAGLFVHDGAVLADQTIEEGRLADVGSADQCDDWHGRLAAGRAGRRW